jgi:hypothetical protein
MERLGRSTALLFIVALSFLWIGCSGDSDDNTSSTPPEGQQPQMDQRQSSPPSSQQAPGQQPQSPQGGQQLEFSDAQVAAAGRIYAKLQDQQQQMQGNDQSRQEATQELQKVMKEAISSESELTGQQFQQFMQGVKQDAELRERFFNALEEAGGQRPQAAPPGGNQ